MAHAERRRKWRAMTGSARDWRAPQAGTTPRPSSRYWGDC